MTEYLSGLCEIRYADGSLLEKSEDVLRVRVDSLPEIAKEKLNKTKRLYLYDRLKAESFNVTQATLFADALNELPALTHVTIGGAINYSSLKILVNAFAKMSNLESLSLDSCNLCDDSVILIGENLDKLPNLSFLGLPDNQITFKGAKALSTFLRKTSGLKELDLSSNFIEFPGGEYKSFLDDLRESNVETLRLNNNYLTEGASWTLKVYL